MTLTIHEVDQRSDEWLNLRCGMVTASVVGTLVTTRPPNAQTVPCPVCEVQAGPCLSIVRKEPTLMKTVHADRTAAANDLPPVLVLADGKTTRDLAAFLAAERIAGLDPDGTFVNRDMWRGVAVEDPARDLYAKHYGTKVTDCGFMIRDEGDYRIGVSPDGLVGDDGGVEIKSPRHKGHLLTAVSGSVPDHHMAQIQTALLVSGRAWWDFVDYAPGMHLWVKRVMPDPDWFLAIHAAVGEFEQTVQQLITDYTAAVEGFPMTEALPDPNLVELNLS